MPSIKVVIPARYGSSRLPGKPLLEIDGKPMFWHVYQRCLEAGFYNEQIILATDDLRIYTKATNLRIPVVMTSEYHQSGTDRINEVAIKLGWHDDTIVINVQGDEPAISPALIYKLAMFSTEHHYFSITTVVTPIKSFHDFHNPNIVKAIISNDNHVIYFTRAPSPISRDNPKDISLALRHIGVYAYRVHDLKCFCSYQKSKLEEYEKLEQLRALSHNMSIGAFIFNDELHHGVDTLEDYIKIKTFMET